jgi:hypothetical protein
LCGADIETIESDTDLQATVDRFIDGHARIKRTQSSADKEEQTVDAPKKVIYEDVSMERGAFLVQQAMRVSLSLQFRLKAFKDSGSWVGLVHTKYYHFNIGLDLYIPSTVILILNSFT